MINSRTSAIVTSRLRRLVVPDEAWIAGLRAVQRRLSDGSRLVIGDGTAGADFVRHAAIRQGIPFDVIVPPANSDESEQDPPLRDRVVLAAAQTVYVLTLRSGGNLHRLLRERLEQQSGTVILVDLPGLQAESSRDELCKLGAQTWKPTADECRRFAGCLYPTNGTDEAPISSSENVYLIAPFPNHDEWALLTHTTRSCPGPWPDESFDVYADSLLESRLEADHSPLGALRRIIRQRRLIASGRTIRGGNGVVSFTACPLKNLPALHRFRPHRVRWDFEPFGLCLRREWLVSRGARPVLYGDNSSWESLSEVDRPFFQLAVGESGIDWSVEREWRHPGDLDLTTLTPEDALVFVPDFEAAKTLAPITPWPITLWPADEIPVSTNGV